MEDQKEQDKVKYIVKTTKGHIDNEMVEKYRATAKESVQAE